MKNLPDNLIKLIHDIQTINNSEVYLVGGCVRDYLRYRYGLNNPPKDYDLLVRLVPIDKLITRLESLDHEVKIVGAKFGVILVDGEFEIALPRTEISTGNGHHDFNIQCNPEISIEEDLGRRDFRCNAIAYNVKRKCYIDHYDGINDIVNNILITVFPNSFKEDPLRMLRAFRFSVQRGFDLSFTSVDISKNAELIHGVSAERIHDELVKILNCYDIGKLSKFVEHNLFSTLFPEINAMKGCTQNKNYHMFDVFTHTITALNILIDGGKNNNLRNYGYNDIDIDYRLVIALIFHDIGKPDTVSVDFDGITHNYEHEKVGATMVRDILKKYKFTTEDIYYISELVYNHMKMHPDISEKTMRKLYSKYGEKFVCDLIIISYADAYASKYPHHDGYVEDMFDKLYRIIKELNNKPFKLAITGNDVMEIMNISQGKIVGDIISYLTEICMEDLSLNNRDYLLKELKLSEPINKIWAT